jgi:hypothetical protein
MTWNAGKNVNSKPAVFGQNQTGTTPSDYSVLSNLLAMVQEGASVLNRSINGTSAEDPRRLSLLQSHTLQEDTPLRMGKVLLSLPYLHCYKVQLTGRQGTCLATAVTNNSLMPLGVRSGEVIPPNSNVIIWKPKSSSLAYILGVVPLPLWDDLYNISEVIQQGGNSGIKKIPAYSSVINAATDEFGCRAQVSGRPIDGVIGEYVRMSETGLGLLIDSFQAYLRVNEATGLFLNYFDDYVKLSGFSMDIQSYAEHKTHRLDEGEVYSKKGYIMYPWEATGMYGPNQNFTQRNSANKVQLDRNFPFADVDVINPGQTSIHRLTEYTGYIGQGHQRVLMRPAKTSGIRLATEAKQNPDIGLFQETLALDGSYGIRSAKQISFVKYPAIPAPQEMRKPEDPQGDDLENKSGYRFSGIFGTGPEHKVKEWNTDAVTESVSLLKPAGVLDMIAHQFNWKSTHTFHYHEKDYDYPQEKNSSSSLSSGVQFYRGKMEEAYVSVEPIRLQIDSRYGEVNYYNTASFFTMLDDGSVVIGDAYGSQITMTGGQIRLEAGGDIMIMSGSRSVTLANEAIIRAKDNVDISASDKDVRIKAENNMQLVAGNSGNGGVLIESKAEGNAQGYAQNIGEDVQSTGITLLAKGSSVNSISKDNYIRTGVSAGDAEGTGNLIIDCANGRGNFINYARRHLFVNSQGLGIYHGTEGQAEASVNKSHFFGPNTSKINGSTTFNGTVAIVNNGSLGVDGSVYSKRQIFALGSMACLKGRVGDSSTNDIPQAVNNFIDAYAENLPVFNETGKQTISYLQGTVWASNAIGNNTFLTDEIGFSFRDKSQEGSAYGYQAGKFFLLETRWQQLDRTGLTQSSSSTWKEKPVFYQGQELYPWPGKTNWADDSNPTFLAYNSNDSFLLFDKTQKTAKDRKEGQADYESPFFTDWKKQTCDNNYKL